ncbi:MAG: hypothetical protein AB1749_16235 [Pseudomonadota bacterium]
MRLADAPRATARLAPVVLAAAAIAACSNSLETASLAKLQVPELPKIELPEATPPVVGTPTEVYTRIARGALSCWFGANGPLKATHIFHAEAEPPHKGGRAQIVIHEKDLTAPSPRGLKAYRVQIAPDGERTTIAVENLKLAKPLGDAMEQDVRRWGVGEIGCREAAPAWTAAAPAPTAGPAGGPHAGPPEASGSARR